MNLRHPAGDFSVTLFLMNNDDCVKILADLIDISVILDKKPILEHFSLRLEKGSRFALMGPSGIGKTTLLRVLAGLQEVSSGKAEILGTVSMVFDREELYPFMTCLENIEMGVPWNRRLKKERREEAEYWASVFDCQSFLNQKASTLSNGQRKRTALARAMMKNPGILLLDETFAALDPALRKRLSTVLLDLQNERGFALVFASHQIQEAELLQAKILYIGKESQAPAE